jgi:hypothetical protein
MRQHTSADVSIRQNALFLMLQRLLRQYLSFCTSKASKLSTCSGTLPRSVLTNKDIASELEKLELAYQYFVLLY